MWNFPFLALPSTAVTFQFRFVCQKYSQSDLWHYYVYSLSYNTILCLSEKKKDWLEITISSVKDLVKMSISWRVNQP